ncbi:hypothetical protein [Streptomyces sindenensis]|uniref:hypothetical protein n=1 Tax=Streptomyces sindenensis TaxID=67363 RepID=UPI0016733010|nr:hypothetical protein [Streptomyces sindenensis]GGP36253.1 hypothetical protein GCM10010231_04220 [Streptomyces sindenensis]
MADEHYEWLDKDAAEKLLRGEPVVPVGDEARAEAFRLAEALGVARAGLRAPAGELPGEDAVLAAFRQAGHGSGADRLAGRAAVPGRPGQLHTVRLGSAPAAPARRPRWSRPVRFGLVASLAGCALGGVAVAAGTGVFTGTFGGQGLPTPASSVSAAVTPGPLISNDSVDDPSAPVDPSSPAEPEATSSPTVRESSGPEESDGARTVDPGRESGTGRPDTPDRPGGDGREETTGGGTGRDDRPGGSGGDTDSGNWHEKSVRACKAFRAGTLDDRSRRQLIEFAKGEKNLERFCDRLLDGNGGSGGGDGGSGGGNGGSGGDGDGDDDGGQSGPGDGGSLPPVSFHPVPRAAETPGTEAGTGADAEIPPLSQSSGAATVLTR